jgi:chromosome segregation protein
VRATGGGALADAIRRDPGEVVKSLLGAVGWVPTLDDALAVQPDLPAGWRVVVRDGSAVVDARTVRLGRGDSLLERRAEAERLARDVERSAAEAATAAEAAETAGRAAADARAVLDGARDAERAAQADRAAAEAQERSIGRDLEAGLREAAWQAAQVARLAAEADRARVAVADHDGRDAAAGGEVAAGVDRSAIATWESRAAELRARRDRLAADHARQEAVRRDAEGRRARAEAAVAMDERRIASATAELEAIAQRGAARAGEQADLELALAAAADRERHAAVELESLLAADAGDRARLGEAERAASGARERLRSAEDRLRSIDVADLEARLGLESLREQTLVELAGLGELGIRHLASAAGGSVPEPERAEVTTDARLDDGAVDDDPARLERALAAVTPMWAGTAPTADAPSPGRLATLRRRFHELGAANPFAVEEYAALRERLTTLEGQAADLKDAIAKTRTLIAELDELIATRFRTTFAQLESAFDARFQQLFGGGFARLSLTDPSDLTATGIEIVARPPGKKPQALAMLSGGERALTAVALLFAMLEVRPVPFCVLDEVDAALDEANVGRFTQALRELAERTQFIVITHNRGTIEAADALYGVTVGDDSVSRVISLRLEEAQALAARQRGVGDPLAVAG